MNVDWGVVGYLVIGVVAGLFAANFVWQKSQDGGAPGIDTCMVFVLILMFWPAPAGAAVVFGVVRAGAWLLPAYRATKRAERRELDQTREAERRREVDRLHRQLGLDPVQWDPS